MPRFPFPLGSTVPAVIIPPPPPPFWGIVTRDGLSWQQVSVGLMPRFEHTFPQTSGADQQFVKITTPDRTILGKGMESDELFDNWVISDVTSTIYVEEK